MFLILKHYIIFAHRQLLLNIIYMRYNTDLTLDMKNKMIPSVDANYRLFNY